MPKYDRLCGACGELWEVTCRISEKHEKDHVCPYCDSIDGAWMLSAPVSSIRPERFSATHKVNHGWNEVQAKIQSRNQRTEICKR